MVHDLELLDQLQALEPSPWENTAYRHMVNGYLPERVNSSGARWNPPDVPALYASLEREGAIAEFEAKRSLEPDPLASRFRVKRRTIYLLRVELRSVLDLTAPEVWRSLGVALLDCEDSIRECQAVGAAAEWLQHDGLLVPSARSGSTNLVVYPRRASEDPLEVIDIEEMAL